MKRGLSGNWQSHSLRSFILKEIRLPSSVGGEINKFVLVGVQSPSKIKPPADGRGVLEVICRASTTRTSLKYAKAYLN